MGNLLGKDCPPEVKPAVKRPQAVGWKPPGDATAAEASGVPVASGRGKLDPKDFIFSGKQKEVLVKEPGSIGGQQFIVEECSGSEVYLLDHTAALTIDVCVDCRIFAGPCESSVFIRDCKDCTIVVACQQFRTRDCSGCTFFLFSATQPVIESSVDLRFACYTLDYFSLAGQFSAANLSVWNNKWSQIFNFTGGEGDWSCLPLGSHHRDFAANCLPESARKRVGYTDGTNGAVVPLTAGVRGLAPSEETCFIVVMPKHVDAVLGKLLASGGGSDSTPPPSPPPPAAAAAAAATMAASTEDGASKEVAPRLVRTKLFRPQLAQSKPFFAGSPDALVALASSSAVLGMQWSGRGSKSAAMELLVASGAANAPAVAAATPTTTTTTTPAATTTTAAATDNNNDASTEGVQGESSDNAVPSKEGEGQDKGRGFGKGKGQGRAEGAGAAMATTEYYMADSVEASATKAKVFFEQWGEDKGTSLAG